MSNFLAIGGVSNSLRALLLDRMELPNGVNNVAVTIDTPTDDDDAADPRINLFLFKVDENPSYKNQEIPGRGHPGSFGSPPLTIDLHYLLTAYGSANNPDGTTDETRAQFLLGSAMRVLHDFPVIGESLETASNQPILDPSLHGQFEKVKLYLLPLSLEDVTKVWTALTLPYRLSIGYKVSLVQIESQAPRRYPQPVGELPLAGPRIEVVTMNAPKIDKVLVHRQGFAPTDLASTTLFARIGDTLFLRGSGFVRNETIVESGAVTLTPTSLTEKEVRVTLPNDPELQAGAIPLKAVRQTMMGDPPTPRAGFKSNLSVVMLVPHVTGVAEAGGTVTITGSRLFQENKNCQTIIGDHVIESAAYTTATETEIAFALPALSPAVYTVRVRVNGAESIDNETITIS